MAIRPAQVWTGSDWDDVGDKRMLTHDHSGSANGVNIAQSSVTGLTDALGSKLDVSAYDPGKILQIVRATDATNRSTTSTSFVDASISVTITPQKNDSAILLIHVFRFQHARNATDVYGGTQITDASNNPISGAETTRMGYFGTNLNQQVYHHATVIGYATPATTSATTYKARFRADLGGTAELINATNTGQMYAIEVSA
jgi:hypothetical protein